MLRAHLLTPEGSDREAAGRALARAEQVCLITNSLKAPVHLDARVEMVAAIRPDVAASVK